MNVLVINCGSSSLKYQLINSDTEDVLAKGLCERIGIDGRLVYQKAGCDKEITEAAMPTHKEAIQMVLDALVNDKTGAVKSLSEVNAVGHRIVHGGEKFASSVVITDEVLEAVAQCNDLAPLHNPANLIGINACKELMPGVPMVAVFDTAFHQSIHQKAYTYAIPKSFLDDFKIRMYGFHGTSHKYVSTKAMQYLNNPKAKIISVHLGNGCSITAVKDGKSIDHSLGFGPVNGLIMGTRSGDIDQSVIFYLIEKLGYTSAQVSELLHKKSGMLGLTGFSDLRDIEANAANGNTDCQLALEMNAYRIKKYIGSYAAAMNGVDAIVFTAGIGENSSTLRAMVCSDMEYLGVELDPDKNTLRDKVVRSIHKDSAKVQVLVIPTNEELEIAQQVFKLCL